VASEGEEEMQVGRGVRERRAEKVRARKTTILLVYIMAKATALRINLNLAPSIPSTPRPPTRNSNADLIYALNPAHHVLPLHVA